MKARSIEKKKMINRSVFDRQVVAEVLATKADSSDGPTFNFDHPSRLTPEDIEEEKDGDSTIVPDEPGNEMGLYGWPAQKEK